MNPMERGSDKVWRPLSNTEAPALSPAISHREKIRATDVPNEIPDSNLNPEEHLLATEEAKNEIREATNDGSDFPEDRWEKAQEK